MSTLDIAKDQKEMNFDCFSFRTLVEMISKLNLGKITGSKLLYTLPNQIKLKETPHVLAACNTSNR